VRSGEGRVLETNPEVDDCKTDDPSDPACRDNDAPTYTPKDRMGRPGIDFDAPLDALMAVGDVVRSGEGRVLETNPDVEEEDFDAPTYTPKDRMGRPGIDFDAPLDALMAVGDVVRSGEGRVLASNPVVDEECESENPTNPACRDNDPI
jgi:hypothetical protein